MKDIHFSTFLYVFWALIGSRYAQVSHLGPSSGLDTAEVVVVELDVRPFTWVHTSVINSRHSTAREWGTNPGNRTTL